MRASAEVVNSAETKEVTAGFITRRALMARRMLATIVERRCESIVGAKSEVVSR